jgi:hypothetical protein
VVIVNSHVDLPHAHEIQQKGPAFFKSKQIKNLALILSISNFGVKNSRPGEANLMASDVVKRDALISSI